MTLVARHSALSDIGRLRKSNEDAYVTAPPLYAVCDGMGGALAGEVASNIAAQTLADEVGRGRSLWEAAETANAAVYARAHHDDEYAGMGTTLTAALVEGEAAHFVHIGDSRAYLLRSGELVQLSEDHSLVAEMVREGRLSDQEAMVHPHRSILSRALGTDPEAQLDEFVVDLREGDVLLLCSDGLSGPVPASSISRALCEDDVRRAAEKLVREALERGGPDNVTVVVVRFAELDAIAGGESTGVALEAGEDDDTGEIVEASTEPTAAADVGQQAEASTEPGAALDEAPTGEDGEQRERQEGRAAGASRASRRLGLLAAALGALVVVGAAAAVLFSSVFFVSVDGGALAIYSGLPGSVGPIPLHAVYRTSSLPYSSLSSEEREIVDQRRLRSRADALQVGRDLGMWP